MIQIEGAASVLVVEEPSAAGAEAVGRVIAARGWSAEKVGTSREAVKRLRAGADFDVVVLVPGGRADAFTELCRTIKFDARTRHASVVCVLDEGAARRKLDLFESGADDCVSAGASDREMALRLDKAARLKRATDSLEDAGTIITALANAVEGKDEYTCGHVDRVGTYAVEIGRRMGVDAARLAALKMGGVVHDIGKVGIPDQVLNKPGKLTPEEMAVMQRHPLIGYEILKPLRTFKDVLPIVRWHHEKPNGSGYPDGLRGDALPLLPRIVSVADVFDALSTDRPYRKAFPTEKCLAIMDEDVTKGNLDAGAVAALREILNPQGVGTVAA